MSKKPGKNTELPSEWSPDLLASLDGRTSVAKALRARMETMHSDLGGAENLSEAHRILVARAAHLAAILESMEAAMAQGEPAPLGQYTQGVNALQGLLKTIGLERRAKALTLNDYLNQDGGANGK